MFKTNFPNVLLETNKFKTHLIIQKSQKYIFTQFYITNTCVTNKPLYIISVYDNTQMNNACVFKMKQTIANIALYFVKKLFSFNIFFRI